MLDCANPRQQILLIPCVALHILLSEQSVIGTSFLLLSLSRRIQLPSKLSWPDVRLFACHDPPPPLARYSTRRTADYFARQDKTRVVGRHHDARSNSATKCRL